MTIIDLLTTIHYSYFITLKWRMPLLWLVYHSPDCNIPFFRKLLSKVGSCSHYLAMPTKYPSGYFITQPKTSFWAAPLHIRAANNCAKNKLGHLGSKLDKFNNRMATGYRALITFGVISLVQSQVEILDDGGFERQFTSSDWVCVGGCSATRSTDSHSGTYSAHISQRFVSNIK